MVEIFLLLQTPSFKDQMEEIMKNNPNLKQVAFRLGNGEAKSLHELLSNI